MRQVVLNILIAFYGSYFKMKIHSCSQRSSQDM